MNLNTARRENRILKSINAFLGTDFKVDKTVARDGEAQRGWKSKEFGFEILRLPDTFKTIGGERPTVKYELGIWVSHGGSYWVPPDYDYVTLRSASTFEDILFMAFAESKKWEWNCKMEYEAEKELDSLELEW